MTTPQQTSKPDMSPALHTGRNYTQLVTFIAIIAVAVLWFFGMYVYGWLLAPSNALEDGRPLRREVSFNLIPRLPDGLAESYDLQKTEQLAVLEDAAGVANIGIDEAFDIMLEEGRFMTNDTPNSDE